VIGRDAPWVGRYDEEQYVRDSHRAVWATIDELLLAPDGAAGMVLEWTESGLLRPEARAVLTALVVSAATADAPPLAASVRGWRTIVDSFRAPSGVPGRRIPAEEDPGGRLLAAVLLRVLAFQRGLP